MSANTRPIVLCECGCGQPAPIAEMTRTRIGHVKGMPIRFISGHNSRGSRNPSWSGGRYVRKGYVYAWMPKHHRADTKGYVPEHVLVVEKALGKPVPSNVEIHHVNEDGTDNSHGNLVACESRGYHKLLHQRLRAYRACGHAHWRKCQFCRQYDDPARLYTGGRVYHRSCENKYDRQRKRRARDSQH